MKKITVNNGEYYIVSKRYHWYFIESPDGSGIGFKDRDVLEKLVIDLQDLLKEEL